MEIEVPPEVAASVRALLDHAGLEMPGEIEMRLTGSDVVAVVPPE